MDVNLISALMQLGGKKSCGINLKRAEHVLKTLNNISQKGMDQAAIFELITAINPSLRPLATVITKFSQPNGPELCSSQNIQYNNFR